MAMKRIFLLFALIALFFVVLCAFTVYSEDGSDLRSRIIRLMDKHQCVGLSVVVVKNNKIVYYDSFGYNPDYTDSAKRKPIKQSDVNYIASISKTFVSTAIMQLKERGKLSLDDDVNKYLDFSVRNPYFPDTPITIRMLMTHRSSLNKLKGAVIFDHFNLLIPESNKDYISCYNNYKPGSEYEYCNYGYVILGAIIEKASGMRFDTYVEENIMKPLGLYGGFSIEKLDSNRFVRAYKFINGEFRKQHKMYKPDKYLKDYVLGSSTPALHPADGMIISSTDLAKFMMMHMNDGRGENGEQIISGESEKEMRKTADGNKSYGLALSHYDFIKGIDLVGMTGGSRGMHTVMFFNPKEKYGFVVFCNGCNSTYANDGGFNKLIVKELYKSFISR